MIIALPEDVARVIEMLENRGFEGYIVGGCVRDSVMGVEPTDWDISTDALPEQTKAIFSAERVIETGIKHGTVTLFLESGQYEITTFRVDGMYLDNRHPESVDFVRDIKEDLARRDFTINALAYNPKSGLIDYFDGARDIESKMIRCVGDPCARFEEDALRIMRALRFSSTLGFEIEKGTSEAMNAKRGLLKNIANERITEELDKLFCGDGVAHVLTEYREVFETIFPEISPLYGLDQNNPHHDLDVWGHTVKSVACAPKNAVIRMTMFLHDIGKSGCYSEVEGVGHFYGHQKVSADLAKLILKRLKYDNDTISTVTQLITFHDADIQDSSKNIKRWLNRLGEHNLRLLVEVKRADTKAHAPGHQDKRLRHLDEVIRQLDIIIAEQHCFSMKDLEINGNDLIEAGIPQGRKIGEMLGLLLDMVIDERVENNREALLNEVKEK